MRVRGEFDRVLDGVRNLRDAGVPIEINFSPTASTSHEIGAAVDLAHELGAYSFYTGRTMYTGNAVKTWHLSRRRTSSTRCSSTRCARRPPSIAAACACTSTRWACSRSCATGCSIRRRC